jgi:hypothetical protein
VSRSPGLGALPRARFSLAALAIASSAVASAQIDVAICAAAGSAGACQFTDPQAKLVGTGLFNTVDIINAGTSTPTLAQLQAYDAVIVWSNVNFQNATLLGDTLADYVDAGGGVVVTIFANTTTTANRFLGGRWQMGYEVILDQGGTTSTGGAQSLGTVLDPLHPVMSGVTTFAGGTTSWRPTSTALEVGATLIAQWTDGKTLVAEGSMPNRIDLGMYPPSNACSASWWDQTTDGDLLMANALVYVATSAACNGSVADICDPSAPDVTDGCTPDVSWAGTPDVTQCNTVGASDFVVTFGSMAENKSCSVVIGKGAPVSIPWSLESSRCFPNPYSRTGQGDTGDVNGASICGGEIAIDVENYLQGGNPLLTPVAAGDQFVVQTWYRDPASSKTTQMTDAAAFTVCP